jgi:uracil phosphoribosyltransferase
MEVKILGNNHSILDQYLAEIRDHEIQKDPLRFRENMYRIGEIFAYEISKSLEYKVEEVITPLGTASVPQLKSQPVLATILRAGLSIHNGLLEIH